MSEMFEIPEEWNLSPQQDVFIGSLLDDAGVFISPEQFCDALYGEECDGPAPAKLRVLKQRCDEIIRELTEGKVAIEVKRNKGWRITKKGRLILGKV